MHHDRPATVVALGTARGPYYLGQKVKVYGLLTSAGSNGATVQAQFISVDSPDGDNDGDSEPVKLAMGRCGAGSAGRILPALLGEPPLICLLRG